MEQQMTMNRKISYVEILEILKYMDEIYVKKIPKQLIEFFEENKAKDYEFYYNNTLGLNEQNLNDNTLALLAMLNLNYWCESEEHKKELINKYNENEQKYQEELREKYNPDNLFKKKDEIPEETIENAECKDLIEYKEENFFIKILRKIKNVFKKN